MTVLLHQARILLWPDVWSEQDLAFCFLAYQCLGPTVRPLAIISQQRAKLHYGADPSGPADTWPNNHSISQSSEPVSQVHAVSLTHSERTDGFDGRQLSALGCAKDTTFSITLSHPRYLILFV